MGKVIGESLVPASLSQLPTLQRNTTCVTDNWWVYSLQSVRMDAFHNKEFQYYHLNSCLHLLRLGFMCCLQFLAYCRCFFCFLGSTGVGVFGWVGDCKEESRLVWFCWLSSQRTVLNMTLILKRIWRSFDFHLKSIWIDLDKKAYDIWMYRSVLFVCAIYIALGIG